MKNWFGNLTAFGIALGLLASASAQEVGFEGPEPKRTPGTLAILAAMQGRLSDQKDVWFEEGDFPACLQVLKFEVEWRPWDYGRVTDLGWMYGNIERKDLELATFNRFRAKFPNEPEAAYPEAEFYFRHRAYLPVVILLEPTIRLPKKPHANSFRLLANAYDRIGMWPQSLRTWEEYLKLAPDDAAAIRNRDRVRQKIADSAKG